MVTGVPAIRTAAPFMDLSTQVPAHDYVESIRAQAIDSILSMMRPGQSDQRAA